jgi:hypothetical protein
MKDGFQNDADQQAPTDRSNVSVFNPAAPAAKAHVRYLGFEGIAGGRRLRLRVKSTGQSAIEVTCDVADTTFNGTAGVSIQDAAPMAYEKLAEMLATEHTIEATKLFLTASDIADYISRHDSHKGRHRERTREHESTGEKDIAA